MSVPQTVRPSEKQRERERRLAAEASNRQVAFAHLSPDLRPLMPVVSITVGNESADQRTFSVQVLNPDGTTYMGRHLVRVWLSDTDYGAPVAADGVSVTQGTVIEEIVANAHYIILTTDEGLATIDVALTGAGDRAMMCDRVAVGTGGAPGATSTGLKSWNA